MKRILVADDDPNILRLVRSYLEQAGYAVTAAADGEEALHRVRSERPDLLVLDVMMPKRDGLSLLRTLRNDPSAGSLPILLLTARVEDVDRIVGLELGADDYVTKPFNPREVVARVNAILRRAQPSAPPQPPLILHGITLDPVAHQVTLEGQIVPLTPSEFDVLYLLMRNPGRVFSRAQLIEEALGRDFEGLERTLDSHIKNLRRKLEEDGRVPRVIETVFGVGYRFEAEQPAGR